MQIVRAIYQYINILERAFSVNVKNNEHGCSNRTFKLHERCQTLSTKDGKTRSLLSLGLSIFYKQKFLLN